MKIDLVDGLLQTSITINYKGQALAIDKMVIDTGASHTLLSADTIADIGVYFENGDESSVLLASAVRRTALGKRLMLLRWVISGLRTSSLMLALYTKNLR